MKEISIKVPGADRREVISIKEGTTAGDVLNNLEMPDYKLRKPGGDVNDTFSKDEVIYDQVKDDQVLRAGTKSPVGG